VLVLVNIKNFPVVAISGRWVITIASDNVPESAVYNPCICRGSGAD
jgi:hypothetical protein